MEPFYTELKNLRERQNIELAEIQNRTKIDQKFLAAIENGQFDVLPLPYIRLFLRAYVTEIGGNPDEALTQLEHYLSDREETPLPETPPDISETPAPVSEEKSIIPRSPKKLRSNLAKSAVLLVVWIFALIIIRKIFVEDKSVTTTPAAQFLTNGVEIVTEDQIRSDFVVFSSRDEVLDVSAPFSVKIVCTNPIGYRVTQDTLPTIPVSLPAGDQQTYSFEKSLEFLLNHSDGIMIYINGEIIRSLYSHPYPVRVSFTTNPTKITVKHYTPIS